MNKHEQIAYRNIKACFDYEVGGWYNCIQDDCMEYIPDTEEDTKEFIYDCAMTNLYNKGYCGCNKAPKEMRFAGKEFADRIIDKLFAEDGDIVEIRYEKEWAE